MTYIHHVAEVFLVGTKNNKLCQSKYWLQSHILPDGEACWSLQFAAVAVNQRQQSSVRDVEDLKLKRIVMARRGFTGGAERSSLFIRPVFIYLTQQWSVTVYPALNSLFQFALFEPQWLAGWLADWLSANNICLKC